MIIGSQPDMEVVTEESTAIGLATVVRTTRPDIVLMDVRMPGVDGITATADLIADLGDDAPKVLVLTTFDTDEAAASAIAAGASGSCSRTPSPTSSSPPSAPSSTAARWSPHRRPAGCSRHIGHVRENPARSTRS